MSSAPSRTPRQRAAAIESLTLLGSGPILLGVLLVPRWHPGLRLGLTLIGAVVLVGTLITAYAARSRAGVAGRDTAMSGWPRWVLVAGLLAGGTGMILVGPSVLAAPSLPGEPAVVEALDTATGCPRGCASEVTFRWGDQEVSTAYPVSIVTETGPGTPFAVDPSDPRHVMPLADLEFARGPGRWWLGLAVLAFLAAPVIGAWGSLRTPAVPAH